MTSVDARAELTAAAALALWFMPSCMVWDRTEISTGPSVSQSRFVDNGQIPWRTTISTQVTDRCYFEIADYSTVRGGWPLYEGGIDGFDKGDEIRLTTADVRCVVKKRKVQK